MTRKHIAQGVGAVALIAVGVVAGVAWTERLGRGRLAGGGGIAAAPEAVQASRQAANTDESVEVVLTLEAVNSQSGEALSREQVEAESKEQVLKALSQAATRLRVVETRPLDVLDLIGIPLPRISRKSLGPALVAA